jgi:hypothetical protein
MRVPVPVLRVFGAVLAGLAREGCDAILGVKEHALAPVDAAVSDSGSGSGRGPGSLESGADSGGDATVEVSDDGSGSNDDGLAAPNGEGGSEAGECIPPETECVGRRRDLRHRRLVEQRRPLHEHDVRVGVGHGHMRGHVRAGPGAVQWATTAELQHGRGVAERWCGLRGPADVRRRRVHGAGLHHVHGFRMPRHGDVRSSHQHVLSHDIPYADGAMRGGWGLGWDVQQRGNADSLRVRV